MSYRLIPSITDEMNGVETYELADGRRFRCDSRAVREVGVGRLLYQAGLGPDPSALPRRPVFWHGDMVGTVPGDFNPRHVRSGSFVYDPRAGDFTEDDKGWTASPTLGLGDLELVDGFQTA